MKIVVALLLFLLSGSTFAAEFQAKCVVTKPETFWSNGERHLEVTAGDTPIIVLENLYRHQDELLKLSPHEKHQYSPNYDSFFHRFRIIDAHFKVTEITC